MSQKPLFQKLRQVALTYLTWRWIWLMLPICLLMMLLSASGTKRLHDGQGALLTFAISGLAMPILFGIQWFSAVAKWQFADPRARLIPGYTKPHLTAIFAVLAVLLVANPLLQAYCQDIPPLGPLAFSLLLGGLFLFAFHLNQGIAMLPAMAFFFSIMHPTTSQFWFAGNSNYLAIHAALALLGAALTAAWLWKLATLHEEDEGYSIQPLGPPGSMSRLERVLQGRLAGRKAARSGPLSGVSDRWHNRLFTLPKNPHPATLSQYGWSRFPLLQQAILVGLALPLYGMGLSHLLQKFDKNPGSGLLQVMVYLAAFAIPALTAAITLRSRRVRMASELLRPANRSAYYNSLFQSLAKRSMLFWLTMHAGALVVWITHQTSITQGDPTQKAIGFLLLSAAVQLPVFALGLRMAQWSSSLLFLSAATCSAS